MTGRSSSSNRLRRQPSSFLKGRSLSQLTSPRMAVWSSARLKKVRLRRRAKIQRSAMSKPGGCLRGEHHKCRS